MKQVKSILYHLHVLKEVGDIKPDYVMNYPEYSFTKKFVFSLKHFECDLLL